jgi:hypothetical protein
MTIYRNQKLSPNGFANEVASRMTQAYREVKVVPGDGFLLCVSHPNCETMSIPLYNHYSMAMKATVADREHIFRFLIQSAQPAKPTERWSDVSPRIVPMVRRADSISAQMNLVTRPVTSNVAVNLVFDSDFSISHLSERNLRAWEISQTEAWRIAYENLSRASFFTHFDKPGGAMMVEGVDGCASSFLLLPPCTFAGSWGNGTVVVPVSKDAIFIFRTDNLDRLNSNLKSAIQMYAEDPRQLSPVPYVWTASGPTEWVPLAEHPCFEAVGLARRMFDGSNDGRFVGPLRYS